MKKKPYRGGINTRESIPRVMSTDKSSQLACPFCNPTHVLVPGKIGICGTALRITAVQRIYTSRIVRHEGMICAKCGEGGGEMVDYMNAHIHLENCSPGTKLLTEAPKFSRWAEFIYNLPSPVRSLVERATGMVQYVKEIDPQGQETGLILGYFFMKGGRNGRARQTAQPTTG